MTTDSPPAPGRSRAAARLKALREQSGLTVREVARLIDRPASTYASYEDKYKKPFLPLDLVRALVPVLEPRGIDPDALLALAGVGRGSTLAQPPAEATVTSGPAAPDVATPVTGAMLAVAELDIRAGAGGGLVPGHAEERVVAHWQLPPEVIRPYTATPPEALKIITVQGDSMEPTLFPGQRVMVDSADTIPSPPGIFVVWDGLGFVIKRVEPVAHADPPRVRISSDNPHYSAYERTLDEAYIQGRVIGQWRWL